jgi:hypothetical protein
MDRKIIEKFKGIFTQMNLDNDAILNEIYSDQVVFIDPIHQVVGLENLTNYFNKLNSNLIEGSFRFIEESIVDNKAYLSWEMHLKLKKPKTNVKASGISVLTIENKIIKHRDYFDAGEVFYENIPILVGIISLIKRKIAK